MIVESTYDGKPLKLIGNPVKVEGVEQTYRSPPKLGENTVSLLRELGVSEDKIAEAERSGAIKVAPTSPRGFERRSRGGVGQQALDCICRLQAPNALSIAVVTPNWRRNRLRARR